MMIMIGRCSVSYYSVLIYDDDCVHGGVFPRVVWQVRIMEPLNEANAYSSKNAFRGRLVFGMYGEACPKASHVFTNCCIYILHVAPFGQLGAKFFLEFLCQVRQL